MIGSTLFDRKLADARVKSRALRDELERWRKLSEAKKPLEKHHSQVRRIAARLEGLLDKIDTELSSQNVDLLIVGRPIEEKLLTVHSIWEFFRSKLAQRLDENFREHLRVCDEFAWQCYEPARTKFLMKSSHLTPGAKEPPLVFLNGGWSPYAVGRDSSFQIERTTGGWIAQRDFREVVESLPVPLVGLPWFQVAHLPDALVIAHEIGHVAEWDFGLTDSLEIAVMGVELPADRLEAWKSWLPEVFADVYGCLAGGPAFAASLMDFLVQGKAKLAAEKRNPGAWGVYPPTWLRISVLVETLRELDYDADALANCWTNIFGAPQINLEFESDPYTVTKALLNCSCTTMAIDDNSGLRPPKVRELLAPLSANPADIAKNISRGYSVGSDDPRVLIAAARSLWESDPTAYIAKGRDKEIRGLIPIPIGTRGIRKEQLEIEESLDRSLGERWFEDLFLTPSDRDKMASD